LFSQVVAGGLGEPAEAEAGLELTEMSQVGSDVVSYSFIITFACPARPGGSQPAG
jgi:hypothetical protein